MWVFYYKRVLGKDRFMSTLTAQGDQGAIIRDLVGGNPFVAGRKYWAFSAIPEGMQVIGADFMRPDTPICMQDAEANNLTLQDIASIDPASVLSFKAL